MVETQIVKDYETIRDFLSNMMKNLNDKYIKEIKTLQKLKGSTDINSWDVKYYSNILKQKNGISDEKIKKYFPIQYTIKEILRIFSNIFKINIDEEKKTVLWDDKVKLYKVSDKNNILIGYFFMDIFNRTNKYEYTRCFSIQSPCEYPYNSKKYQTPIVVLVMSLRKKTKYLTHKNVIDLFHELGHVIHQLHGKSKFNINSGTNVEYDFVEVIGLLYEKLGWERTVLKIISKNKNNKCLSDNIIDKILKTRDTLNAIKFRSEILNSFYDQIVHSSNKLIEIYEELEHEKNEKIKQTKIVHTLIDSYKQLHNKIMSINEYKINYNNNTFMPASWYHLVSGTESLYYSYLWAETYATDIYCTHIQNNILDPTVHLNILKYIIKNTNCTSSYNKVTNLLGRKPTIDNFMKYYNLILEEDCSSVYTIPIEQISSESDETVDSYTNKFSEIDEEEQMDEDSKNNEEEVQIDENEKEQNNTFIKEEKSESDYKDIISETTMKYGKLFA